MCATYSLDFNKTKEQMQRLKPAARQYSSERECTTMEAWVCALRAVSSHLATSRKYQRDDFASLVREGLVHGGATSAVEQGFSKIQWGLSSRQQGAHSLTKRDLRKILLEDPEHDKDAISLAQEVWSRHYGMPRAPPKHKRIHAGLPQPRALKSEICFLRKRRVDAAAAASAGKRRRADDADGDPESWSRLHDKEMEFNHDKLQKKKFEANLNGQLVAGDVDEQFQVSCREFKDARDKLDKTRERERKTRDDKALGGRPLGPDEIRGLKIYIQKELKEPRFVKALEEKGCVPVETRMQADAFVVESPTQPGDRILWRAVLVGAYVASKSAILHGHGVALQYLPALRTRRQIWISPAYRAAFPAVAGIIESSITDFPRSAWKVIKGDFGAFLAAHQRAYRGGRRMEVLALVTSAEQDQPH